MEAYVALCSLQQTIQCLEDCRVISTSCSSGGFLYVVETAVRLFSLRSERDNDLCRQIRDAALEMEDLLESYISNQFLSSQSQDSTPLPMPPFSVDLDEIKQHIDSFAGIINQIVMVDSGGSNDADDDDDVPSRVDFGGSWTDQYFVLSDRYTFMKDLLRYALPSDQATIFLLRGMAGIGKTALAKKLFHDPEISSLYKKRAFVTVGQKYRLERVLEDIQKLVMDPREVDDENMLIVLDDLWDAELPSRLFFLRNRWPARAITILLTSRLHELSTDHRFTMRLMDEKESWDLLRRKLFDEMPCPRELEEAGKKIAEKCQGLPLTIVTVADIMSKSGEKITTEEYWDKVATEKRNSVFMDAYDQMFEVLYRSYSHLDIDYKPCFLYLGAFPQNDEISCSKIIQLLRVEGFAFLRVIFKDLVSNSMIIVHKQSLVVNTCSLHSSFWHMCNKEAGRIKFFHSVDCPEDVLAEEDDDLKGQRRLCIRNNVLLAFKDLYDSMASMSKLRSLLCTGPYHQYPVPIHLCLEYFRLLRILDALAIRFYEFLPVQVLMKLIHLRYLALTYDGKLPASIFKLWSLQYLIVHRHLSIIEAVGNSSSYMPKEIWLMKELKYLHIMGGNLPDPPTEGRLLPKLKTLLDVGPQSCTKDIFESVPNLEKLGIRIELAPDNNDDESLCFFDHISRLRKLDKLKCLIVNPKILSPPPPLPIFPEYLSKLTLSGFGYPWKDMCKIARLPNLQVLKLKCYAFRGPEWELDGDDFPSLEYLMIEDSDLVGLTFYDYGVCLPQLRRLSIKHCYKLQEIPVEFGRRLTEIELVECNSQVKACATKVKEDMYPRVGLNVHSTWDI